MQRASRAGVQVAGRLVGEHDGRIIHERARDGYALLLAAGQRRRRVVGAREQTRVVQHAPRAVDRLRLRSAADEHRKHHVLQRGEVG